MKDDIKKVSKVNKKEENMEFEEQEIQETNKLDGFWYSIIGLCKLLAVVSIAYSTVIIINGMEDTYSKIMVIPQALLATGMLINAFCNKGKK